MTNTRTLRQVMQVTRMVLAGLTLACAEPTAGPSHVNLSPLASNADNNTHHVTGGGQLVGNDWSETYGITAQSDAEGNVTGQVEMMIVGLPGLHGEVSCLAVEGNSAWIGGVVTSSQDQLVVPVGTQFWFRVQDNGEGNGPPDRISSIRLGLAASICAEKRPAGLPWLLERGNITVR